MDKDRSEECRRVVEANKEEEPVSKSHIDIDTRREPRDIEVVRNGGDGFLVGNTCNDTDTRDCS